MTEQDLWIASRRYMRGEISVEELKALEKSYNDTFSSVCAGKAQFLEKV